MARIEARLELSRLEKEWGSKFAAIMAVLRARDEARKERKDR